MKITEEEKKEIIKQCAELLIQEMEKINPGLNEKLAPLLRNSINNMEIPSGAIMGKPEEMAGIIKTATIYGIVGGYVDKKVDFINKVNETFEFCEKALLHPKEITLNRNDHNVDKMRYLSNEKENQKNNT